MFVDRIIIKLSVSLNTFKRSSHAKDNSHHENQIRTVQMSVIEVSGWVAADTSIVIYSRVSNQLNHLDLNLNQGLNWVNDRPSPIRLSCIRFI